ncbi:hypothetical protein GCM10009801_17590 [Streptomyces albiaxialis]|uniref:Uncharacterized protein n=1 Tax=Streptomyces albiaxialis TaxID=329523 RepID=A0ABN2VPY6_9ACTN
MQQAVQSPGVPLALGTRPGGHLFVDRRLNEGLSDDERGTLAALLRRLARNAGAEEPAAGPPWTGLAERSET